VWLVFFIVCLAFAGITAFPLVAELNFASGALHYPGVQDVLPSFVVWIDRVHARVHATNARFSFIFYATDWLALIVVYRLVRRLERERTSLPRRAGG
jgi:hypothetical protein